MLSIRNTLNIKTQISSSYRFGMLKQWRKTDHANTHLVKIESGSVKIRQGRIPDRNITRDKEGHFTMIKRSKHSILNVYTPNNRASN